MIALPKSFNIKMAYMLITLWQKRIVEKSNSI